MSSVRTRTSRIPWLRSDVPTRLGTPSCSIRLRATWRSRDSSSRPNCDSWMPHTSSGLPRTGAGALYSPELAARESRGGLDKPLACRFETLARGAPDASARHTQAANRVASPPCGALWVPAHRRPEDRGPHSGHFPKRRERADRCRRLDRLPASHSLARTVGHSQCALGDSASCWGAPSLIGG